MLLVIDETHTLCAGPAGAIAAWGLEPDLLVVGKPIAGGVRLAAYVDHGRNVAAMSWPLPTPAVVATPVVGQFESRGA